MKKLFNILCIICITLSFSSCKNKVKEIILSSDSIEMQVGETQTIQYATVPESEEELTFKSVDETIVRAINGSNQIEGVTVGETTIIVSTKNGVTATCKVKIIEQPISAYDRLSEDERDFVDCVLKHINDTFKYPDTVVVTRIDGSEVKLFKDALGEEHKGTWTVKVEATNDLGNIITKTYRLYRETGFYGVDEVCDNDDDYRLDLINEAINDMR